MPSQQKPPCPRCKSAKDVVVGSGNDLYYCERCRSMFDNDPDEGGDYDDRDPSRRMEREEERRGKRKGA